MSKATQKLFQQDTHGEPSRGAVEALADGVQAVAPGLSLSKILNEIGSELGRLGVQGQMEMASALFAGSAFVPYGPGQYTPDHDLGRADDAGRPQQEKDGRDM